MDNPSYLGIKYVTLWLLLSLVTGTCANGIVVGQSCSGVRPGTKFTNPENCRTYFGCNSGVYELEYCPSGFYNPQKNDCDLDFKCNQDNFPDVTSRPAVPTSVTWSTLMEEWISTTIDFEAFSTVSPTTRVGEVSTVASSTISESVETTTVSLTTTSSPMTTTEVAIDPNGCPLVDTDEPTYLNDKQNCEKYYLCYHSKAIEMRCISGMYWNAETQMCDYSQNVQCPGDGNGDASPLPKCTAVGRYSMPHPSRCEYFLMCIDGQQTIQQCDAFHTWDVVTQKCLIKDRATCVLDISNADRSDLWMGHGQE